MQERPSQHIGRVEVDGTWVTYHIEGRGLPCLVMPVTWGLDHILYRSFLPLLEDEIQLIFADPRGVGGSGPVQLESEFDARTLASDMDSVRNAINIDQWTMIGHSGGGFVSLLYAIQCPERVARLVLVATAASGKYFQQAIWQEKHFQNRFIRKVREAYRQKPSVANFKKILREIWKQSLFDAEKIVFLEPYLDESALSLERSKYFSDVEREQFDIRSNLQQLTKPTLIIAGRADPQIPLKYTEELAQLMPHARFEVFDESGHYPWIDEPEKFVEVVKSFLRETSDQSG